MDNPDESVCKIFLQSKHHRHGVSASTNLISMGNKAMGGSQGKGNKTSPPLTPSKIGSDDVPISGVFFVIRIVVMENLNPLLLLFISLNLLHLFHKVFDRRGERHSGQPVFIF